MRKVEFHGIDIAACTLVFHVVPIFVDLMWLSGTVRGLNIEEDTTTNAARMAQLRKDYPNSVHAEERRVRIAVVGVSPRLRIHARFFGYGRRGVPWESGEISFAVDENSPINGLSQVQWNSNERCFFHFLTAPHAGAEEDFLRTAELIQRVREHLYL
ncbi:MAG: hypothetical protein V1885_01315 [Candidatus Brennerbacteria bacterium]